MNMNHDFELSVKHKKNNGIYVLVTIFLLWLMIELLYLGKILLNSIIAV